MPPAAARPRTLDAPTAAPRLFYAVARGRSSLWQVGAVDPYSGPTVPRPEIVAKLARGPLWWIEHPAAVFFGEVAQEHWDTSDFADLRPPVATMQLEFPRPAVIASAIYGIQPQAGGDRGHFGLTVDQVAMTQVEPFLAAGLDPEGSVLAVTAFEEPPSGGPPSGGPPSGMTAMGLIPLDRAGRPIRTPGDRAVDIMIAPPPGRGRVGEAEAAEASNRLTSALWPACFALDAVNARRARLEPLPLPEADRRALERDTGVTWAAPRRVVIESLPPREG